MLIEIDMSILSVHFNRAVAHDVTNHVITESGVQLVLLYNGSVCSCGVFQEVRPHKDVSFYRIPKIISNGGEETKKLSEKRRNGFIAAIFRHNITAKILDHDRICSPHFMSGMPASLEEETNPDWLPSLNLGHDKVTQATVKRAGDRWKQRKAREESSTRSEDEPVLVSVTPDNERSSKVCIKGTQTYLTSSMIDHLTDELSQSSMKVSSLCERLVTATPFSEESLHCDECKFYTGFPNLGVLKSVFEFVASPPITSATKLTHFQELMVTLMKLRLDTPLKDLAYRFDVCISTISRVSLA